MSFKKVMLGTAIGASFLGCGLKDSQPEVVAEDINVKKDSVECLYTPVVQKQIFVCLDTDDEDSFTHTKVLESLPDQDSSVLELPINQLYKKYKGNSHPLTVSGISKTVGSLIGINNVKEHLEEHPQHIEHPEGTEITSNTAYHINDTLRFTLRDPLLQGAFPESLKEQLLEPGFEKMADPDSLFLSNIEKQRGWLNNKYLTNNKYIVNYDADGSYGEEQPKFIYDIVVKKLESGKSALAVYRNGTLFLTTYVFVGLPGHETKTGQFEVLSKQPYKRSKKYDNSPMSYGLMFDNGGFFIHQGKVSGKPASHGCVRVPGIKAGLVYSMAQKETDIFIDKNLYKSK